MTILIADDDKNILTLLTTVLRTDGFETLAAKDGAQALDLYLDNRIDMLICDEMMPNLSGNELVKEIRRDDPALPIIMVTAKGATSDQGESRNRQRRAEEGPADFPEFRHFHLLVF